MHTVNAGADHLQYTLEVRARETNVSMFGLKMQWRKMSNVRTRPTHETAVGIGLTLKPGPRIPLNVLDQVFRQADVQVDGNERLPPKPVYDPNLAHEIVKAQSFTQFETIAPRGGVEIGVFSAYS